MSIDRPAVTPSNLMYVYAEASSPSRSEELHVLHKSQVRPLTAPIVANDDNYKEAEACDGDDTSISSVTCTESSASERMVRSPH